MPRRLSLWRTLTHHAIGVSWMVLCLLLGRVGFHAPANAAPPLNILFILADDLGWADLGCMGSTFYRTPNLDRLASQGMRFTQAYSACTVCSPTRAALLTGKYPARLHVTDWIRGHVQPEAKLSVPNWTMHLALEEITVAESLKGLGYATAHIGKWHLGDEAFGPGKQGFDANIGGDHRGQPPSYFAPYRIPTLPEGPEGEYLTDRLAAEAIRFMEAHRAQPFFIYLPHYAVHTPLQAKSDMIAAQPKQAQPEAGQRNPTYAAMIESLDASVGQILKRLDELELTGRTVIFFTSDNGGLTLGRPMPVTSNRPLREGKGSNFEGGVRVPLLVIWPGVTAPGSVSPEPVITVDFYPTLLEIAGFRGDLAQTLDGQSLGPLLRQEGTFKRDALYWHYPHYHPGGATPYGAMRVGDLKLIEFYETGRLELYNLQSDLGETNNLANQMPWKAAELHKKFQAWRESVGAQMPAPNPRHNPSKAPLPSHTLKPQDDGTLLLHAREASVHGATLRYEPQPHKNTLGYWTKQEDWASWDFAIDQPGEFRVEILQGCGPGQGGSDIVVTVDAAALSAQVQETRGFQDFIPCTLGPVSLSTPGLHTLSVKALRKKKDAVMDLRQVRLVPAGLP